MSAQPDLQELLQQARELLKLAELKAKQAESETGPQKEALQREAVQLAQRASEVAKVSTRLAKML